MIAPPKISEVFCLISRSRTNETTQTNKRTSKACGEALGSISTGCCPNLPIAWTPGAQRAAGTNRGATTPPAPCYLGARGCLGSHSNTPAPAGGAGCIPGSASIRGSPPAAACSARPRFRSLISLLSPTGRGTGRCGPGLRGASALSSSHKRAIAGGGCVGCPAAPIAAFASPGPRLRTAVPTLQPVVGFGHRARPEARAMPAPPPPPPPALPPPRW